MTESAAPLPLPRQILTDGVYEAAKELVMDQHIEPGARVNIDRLARQLNVSPTPVREALARLEMDGLVIKEPLRGYSIAPLLDAVAFDDLYDVRLLLEPFAARRASERGGKELVAVLSREIADMRQTHKSAEGGMATYREYRSFKWQDARFHDAIAEASGNPLLRGTLARLRSHLHLYRLYYAVGLGSETIAEHEKILAAIIAHRPEDAAKAMTDHLRRSRARLAVDVPNRAPS
jgi:DNA-binding GntR family transcriptional regulator